jgi:hypothetical protein
VQRSGWAANTTVSSYGEVAYSRPTKDVANSFADVQRAVIGVEHRFDERTRMAAELEWEHAIVSSDDAGEAEVEQVWVERQFDNGVRGRAGLFLMPVGLLNQYHEPTAYYGVFRSDTDTKIIPSTWRESASAQRRPRQRPELGRRRSPPPRTSPTGIRRRPKAATAARCSPSTAKGSSRLSRTFGGVAR